MESLLPITNEVFHFSIYVEVSVKYKNYTLYEGLKFVMGINSIETNKDLQK